MGHPRCAPPPTSTGDLLSAYCVARQSPGHGGQVFTGSMADADQAVGINAVPCAS